MVAGATVSALTGGRVRREPSRDVLDDLAHGLGGDGGRRPGLAAVLEVLVEHRQHREEDDEQDRGLEVVADDRDAAEEVAGQGDR